ncbi:MAG: hydroxyethylthiazole kinase [Bacillota bacterium]|nr:hydroxyethylthiazole kinase [Bacillota bacterium]
MDINKSVSEALKNVKAKNPLVHHITNYVTVNDCANVVLAIGGSPVMADDISEVEDMVSIASSLVLNIGTLNSRTIESMIKAGKKANELKIPVILDPVGAGATPFRTETALKIINSVKLAVIRGNSSEIKTISGITAKTKGVDAGKETLSKEEALKLGKNVAEELSEKLGSVIAITGKTDIVSYKNKTYFIENGHKMLSKITGTGCMCTSLIGSYLGANENYHLSAIAGIVSMGIAGELAYNIISKRHGGSGNFKIELLDAIYNLSSSNIIDRAQIR